MCLWRQPGRARSLSRHTQTFLFLFQKDTQSAPNKSLKSPTSHQGKSLNYCVTKAAVCIISLHMAKLGTEIKGKAGSINIAVWTTLEVFAGLSPLKDTAKHPTTQMKDVNRAVPVERKAVYYTELLSHPAKCADLNNVPLSHRINLSICHKETERMATSAYSSGQMAYRRHGWRIEDLTFVSLIWCNGTK